MEGIRIPARYEAPRAGDVRHSQADISAAVAELGHAPRFSIEDGLGRTLEWYRREGEEEGVRDCVVARRVRPALPGPRGRSACCLFVSAIPAPASCPKDSRAPTAPTYS